MSERYVETVIDSSLCFPSKENNETSHEWVKKNEIPSIYTLYHTGPWWSCGRDD